MIETHAVIACYPLIVAVLSVPFLQEKFGWRRCECKAFGFIGVMTIIRPSLSIFSGGSIFALLGAILFAIYLILTRYASKQDNPFTNPIKDGLGGTITMSIVGIFIWKGISQEYWIWLLLMCVISGY